MNKEGRFQNVLIILLAVAVVGMSIGFAAIQSQLTINGNATFKAAKWEVIWDNGSVHETEVNGTNLGTVTVNNNNLNVDYTVTLKPNTAYSFTVDIVNNGTFPAKLTGITFNGKSPAQMSTQYGTKIGYTFMYGTTPYTQNVSPNTVIQPNGKETVTVSLTYPLPGEVSDLLGDEDVHETLGVQFNFVPVVE